MQRPTMTTTAAAREHSTAYNVFILVMTIMSLGIMVMTRTACSARPVWGRHRGSTAWF